MVVRDTIDGELWEFDLSGVGNWDNSGSSMIKLLGSCICVGLCFGFLMLSNKSLLR